MSLRRIAAYFLIFSVAMGCADNKQEPKAKDSASVPAAAPGKKKTIVFFGNSLTAGYGLTTSEAFPALIQQKIDSLNLPYTVVNAGVSGETTSGGNTRIDWVLKQPLDVFVLELGGNDGLRGIPVSETKKKSSINYR